MNSRALLGVMALVVLGLLLWELRWVATDSVRGRGAGPVSLDCAGDACCAPACPQPARALALVLTVAGPDRLEAVGTAAFPKLAAAGQ